MDAKQFVELFPIKGEVTEEILKKSDKMNTQNCNGALALKAALNIKDFSEITDPLSPHTGWGTTYGIIKFTTPEGKTETVSVTTKENINMFNLKKPAAFTFTASLRKMT